MDELSFEVGELIDVMEYDDPEEQVSEGPLRMRMTGLMFDLAGGGLAVWSQGVHWTEGAVPGKLHQTHLDISDSARDLVLSTPTVIFCKQLSIFKYFFN